MFGKKKIETYQPVLLDDDDIKMVLRAVNTFYNTYEYLREYSRDEDYLSNLWMSFNISTDEILQDATYDSWHYCVAMLIEMCHKINKNPEFRFVYKYKISGNRHGLEIFDHLHPRLALSVINFKQEEKAK